MTSALSTMSSAITSLLEIFVSLFNSAFELITGNWYLLAFLGLPLVGGVIFAIRDMLGKN